MPVYDETRVVEDMVYQENRGNLFVLFNVVFPKYIPSDKKEEITDILKEAQY